MISSLASVDARGARVSRPGIVAKPWQVDLPRGIRCTALGALPDGDIATFRVKSDGLQSVEICTPRLPASGVRTRKVLLDIAASMHSPLFVRSGDILFATPSRSFRRCRYSGPTRDRDEPGRPAPQPKGEGSGSATSRTVYGPAEPILAGARYEDGSTLTEIIGFYVDLIAITSPDGSIELLEVDGRGHAIARLDGLPRTKSAPAAICSLDGGVIAGVVRDGYKRGGDLFMPSADLWFWNVISQGQIVAGISHCRPILNHSSLPCGRLIVQSTRSWLLTCYASCNSWSLRGNMRLMSPAAPALSSMSSTPRLGQWFYPLRLDTSVRFAPYRTPRADRLLLWGRPARAEKSARSTSLT